MKTKIVEMETLDFDTDLSHNGGSYGQPYGVIDVTTDSGRTYTVTVDDYSCGDFGIRRNISIRHGNTEFKYHLDSSNPEDDREVEFLEDDAEWYSIIRDSLWEIYQAALQTIRRGKEISA